MHQPMDPLYKELPGLLLEPLHHYSPFIFIHLSSLALSAFFRGVCEHMEGTCS
jgi:hypothetical protein